MPLTKSAKKSYRSSERKRAHNLVLETKLKKALKSVKKENSGETISIIDKMAKRHLISKNKASRLKSRIAKKFGTPKITQKARISFESEPEGLSLRVEDKNQNDNVKIKKKKVTEKQNTDKKPAPKPKTSSKK